MTSKELAKLLGLSEASVSFALNNKPGVSTETRNRILEEAAKHGMNVDRAGKNSQPQNIYFIYFRKHGAVLNDSSFFSELTEGVENGCAKHGFLLNILNVYSREQLQVQIEELSAMRASGIILLGTEMQQEDFNTLAFATVPTLLLDNHFLSSKIDSVRVNNTDGAYAAVNYLINKCKCVPGYLHSSYSINNFAERYEGFRKALRYNGFSSSGAVVHELTPSIEGAYHDMCEIIKSREQLASCYFADNDQIAIGAMRALRENGFSIPKDISIIGFDDIPMSAVTEPPLTTVHVPKRHMGMIAVDRLASVIREKDFYPVSIEIATNIVARKSIR